MNKYFIPLLSLLVMAALSGCSINIDLGGEDQKSPKTPNSESEVQNQEPEATKKAETPKSEPKAEPADSAKKTPKSPEAKAPDTTKTTSFRGSYFDIKVPATFKANPSGPMEEFNGIKYVQTDEATFISPDGEVEFFIYSPLWSGDPASYLSVAATEKLDSEKSQESGTGLNKTINKWATISAKDGSYARSYHSIRNQVDTGSDTHKVFGYKYKNQAAYNKYLPQYQAFKSSLMQYAD